VTAPNAVSSQLRQAGFGVLGSGTPTAREGIRVKRSTRADAVVVCDFDSERRGIETAAHVAWVIGRSFGLRTEVVGNLVYVLDS
jgi:hypothetical protein